MEQLIVHEIHQILLNFYDAEKNVAFFHGALLMHNKSVFRFIEHGFFGIIQ